MIIKCVTHNDYDYFNIENINSIEELKPYAEKNIPLDCAKLSYFRKYGTIFIESEGSDVSLYLHNYLYYRDVTDHCYLLDINTYESIVNVVCSKCKYNNVGWEYCEEKYVYSEDDICKNFKLHWTYRLSNLLKNKRG